MTLIMTSRLAVVVLVASAVTSWCSAASDSTGYVHIGCYYEVHKCGSPPYYIENHQPNTSLFDICSNFTNNRAWKSFGIQTFEKTDCITGPHFHTALNPFCFKPGNCSNDRGNVTRYSYDVYVKVNISVFVSPKILIHPTSQRVAERSNVSMTCYLEGKPVSTVTWFKDGTPIIPDNEKRISVSSLTSVGNTSATITITNVNRTDEGYYSCQAVNDIGNDTSSAALLTVNYPPKILIPPTRQSVIETSNVTLTCYLEGKPVSTVTWIKDGTPIIPDNEKRISLSPPNSVGNTSATITITRVNRTDEGYYTCQAANDIGNVTPSPALLTVNYSPKILVPPTSQTIVERSNVTLTCYLEGKPVSTVTWIKDGTPIIPDNEKRISLSSPTSVSNTSATITITRVNRTDEGYYSCQAANDVGNDTSSASLLTVNYPPKILIPPTSQTVVETSNVSLTCFLEGKPLSNVTWFKDGITIIPDNDNRISVSSPTSVGITHATITITIVNLTDEGNYSCQAANDVGNDTSYAALLTIIFAPKILIPPTSQRVSERSNVSMTCYLEGKPLSYVTWFKDGITIIPVNDNRISVSSPTSLSVSNTSATITITRVKRTDEGNYSCHAANEVGNDNSSAALLTVNYSPKILISPTSQTVVETSNVTLTCYLEGKPVSNVTWIKDGTPIIPDNEKRISVSSPTSVRNASAIMIITRVNRTNEGNYSCQAVNNIGNDTSSAVLLTINYPSKILIPPTSQSVIEKSNVTLTCYLEGKPVSTVTWIKDGTPIIPDNEKRISVSSPTSVRNASAIMVITRVNRTDEGNYSCQAVNDIGNDTSSTALLTIVFSPKILIPPTSQTVVERSNVSMTCYLEGKPLSNVTWFKDGTPIIPANDIRISVSPPISVGNTSSTITITRVNRTDEGNYSCQAVNNIGNDTSSAALLTVNYSPMILISPTSQTAVETSNLTLTCYLEGKPLSNVTWFKDGTKIIHVNDSRISVSSPTSVSNTSATITITRVKRTDEGYYTCGAANDIGNDTSSAALLAVNFAPKILVPPTSQRVAEGSNVSMTCYLEGKPLTNVTWFKDGTPIIPVNDNRISVSSPTSVSNKSATITITRVNRTDEANYSCQAANDVGNDTSSSALMTVIYPPKILMPLTSQTVVETSNVSLTCYLEGKPVSTLTWIKDGTPIIPAIDSRISVSPPISVSNTSATITITRVNRTDEANYSCQAANDVGNDTSSSALMTVNFAPKILIPPTSQTVVERSNVSMTCYLEGKPLSIVTWFKDGITIIPDNDNRISLSPPTSVGNTSATITITRVNRTDEGYYSCQAANDVGHDTSSAALLTVIYKPRITKQLTNTTVIEGKNVSFVCLFNGHPEPKVKWLKDNTEIKPEQDSRISISADDNTMTVKKARKDDEGRYECRVENNVGHDMSSGTLVVKYDGSFAVRPRNKTYIEGQEVILTCNRDGMGKAKVHWMMKKNHQGSMIDILQIGTRLTIAKLRRTDQGNYCCKAKYDSSKSHFSLYGYVNVNYKPKVLQPPSHSTKNENESVTLTCTFEGKPFPSVTWLKNGQELDINSSDRISILTQTTPGKYVGTSKLQISKLRREDQGNFSCSVKNRINSSFSEQGFLEIRYPPVIFSSPRNATKNESDQIQLSCTMEGNPKPTVSWKKDGHIIDKSQDNRMTFQGNSSLWEFTITVTRLKDTDAGGYVCVAKNAATEQAVSSQTAKLIVNFLHDVFISTPKPYILRLGQKNASLQCNAVGFPKPILSWYKDGKTTTASHFKKRRMVNNSIVPGEHYGNMSLTGSKNGVSYDEAGNYTCVAYSRTLNKTTRDTVEVLFKPEIQHRPTDQTPEQGTRAPFYCNATGVPEPVISWKFSGRSTFKRTGNKMVIDNVQNTKDYEGWYTCIASSRAGRTEESASLNVLVPPTGTAVLAQNVMLQLGQNLRLKCDVYGDPEPSFEWTKRLPGKSEEIILRDQKKTELVILDVRLEDAAHYGCTATNRVGNITLDDVFIDVDTSLDIINSGEIFNATEESSATVRCIASSEASVNEVKLFKDDKELETHRSVSNDKKVVTAEIKLTKVSTDDSGNYTCVAKNRQKEVRADVALIINVPITVEMDVSLKNKTFTEELRDNSSQEYKNLTAEFIEEMTKVYINETGFVRVEVLGFSNGSVSVQFRVVYRFKVQNPEEKPSPDSKVRIANVLVRRVKKSDGIVGKLVLNADSLKPRVKPPAPRNLTAINIKKTSVTIQWSLPLFHDHYSVENYVVMSKEFSSSWKKHEVGGQHVNTLLLENLEPDASYSIKAHAVNHMGEGLASKIIEVKTHSDFWNTFTKVFVPLFVLLVIGVVVLLYLQRRRTRRGAKLMTEVEGKRCYDEFHNGSKQFKCEGGDTMEMVELPMRCKSIPRENIELGKELGSGQFGVVYKGFLKEKGEEEDVPCAVKMLKPGASESDYRDLFNELEIMCSVEEHPNIVNLLGACKGGDGPLYVVVEFAENGCLLDYLRENRISTIDDDGKKEEVSSLDNQEKIGIALDIAKGMKHLASHKCVHRDLAARNILLGKDRIAKVADFGLARDVYEQGFYEKSSTGGKLPAKWMSIEALETLKATTESDVWSFGVLLWEIETGGKMPYAGLSYMDLLKALKSGVRLQKPTSCSDELYSIMKDCWEANPEKRPKFEVLSLVLDNLLMATFSAENV